MEIVRGFGNLKERHRGSVATIGNFDGVHKGHQSILKQVTEKAADLGVPAMLICFEPQPKEFFDEYNAPARLTRFREKVGLLAEIGIDIVLCLKFDERTRSETAREFVNNLSSVIRVSALFVGDDFKYGNDRSGNFELLEEEGRKHGFEVTNQYTMTHGQIRVSSSHIRECLAKGDFHEAEQMLGHPYSIVGKVVYGRQVGRTLGVPTVNLQLHRYRAPLDGVYAVEIKGLDKNYQGVANVGVRPTFDEETPKPILEVHIFEFSQDIYGKYLEIVFRHKIREEKKFDGIEALKSAIFADIESAKEYFRGG
ncbi:MAG: bifunctional riboflavin kinase/FAD synthetase [Gammaproteobacteria bacterium]|nr:MAG: bifunctional riboflavin kinase/FAD synthetase [Gammaproteobacteria bacterium]